MGQAICLPRFLQNLRIAQSNPTTETMPTEMPIPMATQSGDPAAIENRYPNPAVGTKNTHKITNLISTLTASMRAPFTMQ